MSDEAQKLFLKFAHDVRNPLGVVTAYSQLLTMRLESSGDTDPKLLQQIQTMSRCAQRIEDLVALYEARFKELEISQALTERSP